AGNLAATMPKPGLSWQAAGFEAIITFGLVLMVLNLANGPKLNGPFVPLAVGAYILAWGTMGGPFDGASMNPARSFGPDVAIGDLSTWWVYLIGPVAGAVTAVGVAYVLRGAARAGEARAAGGTPPDRPAWPSGPFRWLPNVVAQVFRRRPGPPNVRGGDTAAAFRTSRRSREAKPSLGCQCGRDSDRDGVVDRSDAARVRLVPAPGGHPGGAAAVLRLPF